MRNARVTPIRFHDLRHTHASLLIKEGIPVKVVSERRGHRRTPRPAHANHEEEQREGTQWEHSEEERLTP